MKDKALDFINKHYEEKGMCLDDFDVLTNTECIDLMIMFSVFINKEIIKELRDRETDLAQIGL